MKKNFSSKISLAVSVIILLSFTGIGSTFAQDHKVEITPFGGYLLGGSINFYEGKFKIEDAACYGGMIAVQVHSGNYVEFSYTGMSTQGNWQPNHNYESDYPERTVKMAVNHFLIGSVSEIPLDNEAIRPYGTASIGTTWCNIQEDDSDDEWFFTCAIGVGLKYFFNDRIGIRMQARMLLPLVFNGGSFYVGTSSYGWYVSSTAPIVQGDFTGGLIIALGNY